VAKCKWCDKGGIFRSVDSNGLCGDCRGPVLMEIEGRLRVIRESAKLAEEGKTFATRLGRCDTMIEHAGYLLRFENKGIPTVTTPPSTLVAEAKRLRSEMVAQEATAVAEKAMQKAEIASTPATKERALTSGILKVREVAEKAAVDASAVATVERRLKNELHRVKLDGFLEAARKAEFKGNTKKAIDQYQEALYFIRNDGLDDVQQRTEIAEIEATLDHLQAGQSSD
jgi:hypothetical protein